MANTPIILIFITDPNLSNPMLQLLFPFEPNIRFINLI